MSEPGTLWEVKEDPRPILTKASAQESSKRSNRLLSRAGSAIGYYLEASRLSHGLDINFAVILSMILIIVKVQPCESDQ